jgi:hypothetical protein
MLFYKVSLVMLHKSSGIRLSSHSHLKWLRRLQVSKLTCYISSSYYLAYFAYVYGYTYLTLVSVLFRNSHYVFDLVSFYLFCRWPDFFFWSLTRQLTIVCVVLLFYNLRSFTYLFILRIFNVLPSLLFSGNVRLEMITLSCVWVDDLHFETGSM